MYLSLETGPGGRVVPDRPPKGSGFLTKFRVLRGFPSEVRRREKNSKKNGILFVRPTPDRPYPQNSDPENFGFKGILKNRRAPGAESGRNRPQTASPKMARHQNSERRHF